MHQNHFILPNELPGYAADMPVFFYEHLSRPENNNSSFRFTSHCISIGINGRKMLQSAAGTEKFAEGDLVFYRPGNSISYRNFDNTKPYRSLMIFFNADFFKDIMTNIGKDIYPEQNNDTGARPFEYVRAQPYLINFVQSFELLNQSKEALTLPIQKVKVLELICYLAGLSQQQLNHVSDADDNHFRAIIRNNIDTKLTLDALADQCNMSLAAFKRTFTRIYGVSPGKWIKQQRLIRAAAQIALSKLPKEVFAEAGYEDYSSFSHAFKEMFGVSPKNYKKAD